MARTLGAKNRTPRELKTESAHLAKEAKLKDRIAALKNENEALKKK
jgi:hypothetical protein